MIQGLSNGDEDTCGNFYVRLDVDTPVINDKNKIQKVKDLAKLENLNEIYRLNKI